MVKVRPTSPLFVLVWNTPVAHSKALPRFWRSTAGAARFLKNCYEREPGTVTNFLKDLNWDSLELRRKIARLTTKYKMVNNKIRANIPEYISRPTLVTRSYHSSKLINIGNNSNTYKYNFFTRTLKEWNSLPSFLLDQPSVKAFKSAFTNYFSLPHWFYTSFYFIIYLLYCILFFAHSQRWETFVNYNR